MKIAVFDEFVQVETQQFKCNAQMISKDNVILNSHNVILIVRIVLLEKLQDFNLNLSLMLKLFLVSYDLQCNKLFMLVIEHF